MHIQRDDQPGPITLFTAKNVEGLVTFHKSCKSKRQLETVGVEQIIEFWRKRGFRLERHSAVELYGKRGSRWWGLVLFDLKKLPATLTIKLRPERNIVDCVLEVDARAQYYTKLRCAFFEWELASFVSWFTTGNELELEGRELKRQLCWHNLKLLAWIILAAMVVEGVGLFLELLRAGFFK